LLLLLQVLCRLPLQQLRMLLVLAACCLLLLLLLLLDLPVQAVNVLLAVHSRGIQPLL
jgi:hypothetical protein